MPDPLFSIRMRATSSGKHVSGMERLVPAEEIASVVQALVGRALGKQNKPDSMTITIDQITSEPACIRALDITSITVHGHVEGRSRAARMLADAGVSEKAAMTAIALLAAGAAEGGGNMRGAVLMDAATGARFEQDRRRGIRTSRIDWNESAGREIDRLLASAGLTHFRTREALALASKTVYAKGVIAELCWSDDPDYTAGYIASKNTGYVRFSAMKPTGDPFGGRVYFIDREKTDQDALIRYLQEQPVLIDAIGQYREAGTESYV